MTLLLSLMTIFRSRICALHQTKKRSPRSGGSVCPPVAVAGGVCSPAAGGGVWVVSRGRFSSSPAAAAKASAAVDGAGCVVAVVAGAENGDSIPVGSAKGSSAAAVWCAVSSPVAVAGRSSSAVAACGVNVPPVAGSANGSSAVAGVAVCGVAVSSHGKVWSLKVSGASGTVAGGGDDAGTGAGW